MPNHIKKNPAVFFDGWEDSLIFGCVLPSYPFGYPHNSRFFLTLCPEHFHFLPSRLPLALMTGLIFDARL
jgi:hypothetical protein